MSIIWPLIEEITVTSATPSTVSNFRLVRIFAAAQSLVTVRNAANVIISSFTIPAGGVQILRKTGTDTVVGSTDIRVVPVSYSG